MVKYIICAPMCSGKTFLSRKFPLVVLDPDTLVDETLQLKLKAMRRSQGLKGQWAAHDALMLSAYVSALRKLADAPPIMFVHHITHAEHVKQAFANGAAIRYWMVPLRAWIARVESRALDVEALGLAMLNYSGTIFGSRTHPEIPVFIGPDLTKDPELSSLFTEQPAPAPSQDPPVSDLLPAILSKEGGADALAP